MKQEELLLLQGARAVRSGEYGEAILHAAFNAYKVKLVQDSPEWLGPSASHWATRTRKILIEQCRLRGGRRKIDFVYRDFDRDLMLPIEHKQQKVKGSTEEKLSTTVDRLVKTALPYWLIMSGRGFTAEIIREVAQKIKELNASGNPQGRLVFDYQLQEKIERLVERGEI